MKHFKNLMESLPAKTVVFAFGRFNPPTTGHELLVKFVKKLAKSGSADHVIYASGTQDKKKNPLPVDKKVHYLNLMFPGTNFVAAGGTERTFIEAAKHLNKKYRNLIMVAGSDRVQEYERLLNKQNGIDFNFDSIKVSSAGDRDADSDDASGMSASKMRAAASKGDYATFKKGLPSTLRDIDGKRLMNDVRAGLGLEHIKENIKFQPNALREAYLAKQIFNIGDVVESAGNQFEIVDRGSNYLTVVDGEGQTHRKWLHECAVVQTVVEDIQPGYAPDEISFKGFTTKNLHHSADAAKAFQGTIERYGKLEPATVLAALKATDAYMKINDMHLEQGEPPDEAELAAWRDAHQKARDSLNRVGEFIHHQDYWHMHEHEIQDMEANYNVDTAGAEMADSYQPQAELIEATKIVDDGSVLNVHHNKQHIGNIFVSSSNKATPYKAYSKHWDMSRLHKTKKGAVDWLVSTHQTAVKEGVELVEASAAARFNQKVKQAQASHEAGDHKKAKYHLDTARNFMLGINSNDHSKIKDSYPKYKELRDLHKEEVELDEEVKHPSEDQVSRDLKARYGEANYKSKATGSTHRVTHDGKHYRTGMMRSTSLSGLLHLVDKKVNNKTPASGTMQFGRVSEELTDKTIKSGDKVKVARVIADMLGVENAETLSPEVAVNTGLRKIKNKRMTPEMTGVVKKMLALAQEVGIKVDITLVPKTVSEDVVNKGSTYNVAKDILRYKDFAKLKKMNGESAEVLDVEDDDGVEVAANKVGHTLHSNNPEHDTVRRMKVAYKTESLTVAEDEASADYKINPKTGRKYRAHKIEFANSGMKDKLEPVKEEVEEDDFSEDDLEAMANGVTDPEHVLDAYDDSELAIVDTDTGEEVDTMAEEVEQINEVLSRIERMKAKIRFARTASKRERRIQVALRTRSSSTKINARARRLAVNLMKQRIIRKPVANMTVQEKERAEAIIARRKEAVGRLAMKLAPRVRKIENDRLSHSKVTK
jgi:phosphopantetheine adenylyltransferase